MKEILMMVLAFLGLFSCQVKASNLLEKTYEWETFGNISDLSNNTYQVTLTTQDYWRVNSSVNITFRFALVKKGFLLNRTGTERVEINLILGGSYSPIASETVRDEAILVNEGDYWEKNISLLVSERSVNIGPGKAANASVGFYMAYYEVYPDETHGWITSHRWVHDEYDLMYGIKLWGLEKEFTIDPIDLAALIIICSLVGIFGLYKFTRRKKQLPQA